MTIVGTASQPFVALCLITGGMIYSALCFVIGRIEVNKTIYQIISFFLTVTGAVVYFTILYFVNSGEMRLYTAFSFILGLISGFKILNKLFNRQDNKNRD